MPSIAAVAKIDLPYRIEQQEVKRFAKVLFPRNLTELDRLFGVFDHAGIESRNLCKPLQSYASPKSFQEMNKEYVQIALEYSVQAIQSCLERSGLAKEAITDIIFVSSTGLATPSLDALIANRMRLRPDINRIPVFGLGCAGGVSGVAKAAALATANPSAIVILVAVELCSLTLLKSDFSKSNVVAASLFSDGIAACIIAGDANANLGRAQIISSRSRLYYDTLDVMGWEFLDAGFKVVFSQDIPSLINQNIKKDVADFLAVKGLRTEDIKNFVFHPGGTKVLQAYEGALALSGEALVTTRRTMSKYGNMSSATALYVLESFLNEGCESGYGLMLAMGPGFSSEMALLRMTVA